MQDSSDSDSSRIRIEPRDPVHFAILEGICTSYMALGRFEKAKTTERGIDSAGITYLVVPARSSVSARALLARLAARW